MPTPTATATPAATTMLTLTRLMLWHMPPLLPPVRRGPLQEDVEDEDLEESAER